MHSLLAKLRGGSRGRLIVRPDCDYVFLSGQAQDAQDQYLRGKIVLYVPNGDCMVNVHLAVVGRSSIRYVQRQVHASGLVDDTTSAHRPMIFERETREFVLHRWERSNTRESVSRLSRYGVTHEWLFELLIRGSQDESSRGCSLCLTSYRLEATASTRNVSAKMQTSAPIRIIRCLDVSSYELMNPFTVHGYWSGGVEYKVTLCRQAIALGGLIHIEAEIITHEPLLRVIGAKFCLLESHTVYNDQSAVAFHGERTMSEWRLALDKTSKQQIWQQNLPLPKVVRSCSPSFNTKYAVNSHTMRFIATISDDVGATSEVRANIESGDQGLMIKAVRDVDFYNSFYFP